jgi:cytochrome c-type biogenesis protein CcmI
MIVWIAAILLITAVALFIAAPLSDHQSSGTGLAIPAQSEIHHHEHALAVQALRELEFDRAMGKLDTDDYHTLRQRLEVRALAAMRAPQKTITPPLSESNVALPAPSQSITAARISTVNFCVECGARFGQRDKFCPNCGAGRALEAPAVG